MGRMGQTIVDQTKAALSYYRIFLSSKFKITRATRAIADGLAHGDSGRLAHDVGFVPLLQSNRKLYS